MSKVKNQYLLAAVVFLSIVSTILCLALVMSEKSNSRHLEKLQADFSDSGEKHKLAEKELEDKVSALVNTLKQLDSQVGGQVSGIEVNLQAAGKRLSSLESDLKKTKDCLDPLASKLERAEKKLSVVEDRLKKP